MHRFEVRRAGGGVVELEVVGNAFVKNMVRIFAGTLRDVGRGRLAVADARRVLEARDRSATGMTAPPGGLCLEEVIYDDRLPPKRGREVT
jgi:tRNA pseudouridine38-40 synthase